MPAPAILHRFLDALPGDADTAPQSREVTGAMWSKVQPTKVAKPKMLAWSAPLAEELGLSSELMGEE